jgi:uncharacterized membrane protein YhiD involved in acid resistance
MPKSMNYADVFDFNLDSGDWGFFVAAIVILLILVIAAFGYEKLEEWWIRKQALKGLARQTRASRESQEWERTRQMRRDIVMEDRLPPYVVQRLGELPSHETNPREAEEGRVPTMNEPPKKGTRS